MLGLPTAGESLQPIKGGSLPDRRSQSARISLSAFSIDLPAAGPKEGQLDVALTVAAVAVWLWLWL